MILLADGSRRQVLDGARRRNNCVSVFSVAKFQGVFYLQAVDPREDWVKDVGEPEDSRASCCHKDFISEGCTTHNLVSRYFQVTQQDVYDYQPESLYQGTTVVARLG